MLKNEETIKNGQFRETGNIGYTRQRKTKHVLDTTGCKQAQITKIRHEPSYKQLEVKMNRTSVLCGNHNGLL